jgi:hypothetical protein
MKWKLISEMTGEELRIGDLLTTFDGEKVKLIGLQPPHKKSRKPAVRSSVRTVSGAYSQLFGFKSQDVIALPIVVGDSMGIGD